MGTSNIATATNAVAAAFIGRLVIDAASRFGSPELWYTSRLPDRPSWLAIGALLLRQVDERRREGGWSSGPGNAAGVGRRLR